MIPVGLGLVFAGYSLIYIGVFRLKNDKRTVADIWLGRSAVGNPGDWSFGGGNFPANSGGGSSGSGTVRNPSTGGKQPGP